MTSGSAKSHPNIYDTITAKILAAIVDDQNFHHCKPGNPPRDSFDRFCDGLLFIQGRNLDDQLHRGLVSAV